MNGQEVVYGFNKNHGHSCRPLTNRYVMACAERRYLRGANNCISGRICIWVWYWIRHARADISQAPPPLQT
jgi:hypothetical protein